MVCDLNHRLAISEASFGRKKSCSHLSLKVRAWVVFAIRWPLRHQQWASACGPSSMPHHRRDTLFGMLWSLLVCMALLLPAWFNHPEYRILKRNAQH